MDLDVGKHCAVSSCNVRDLLPIRCQSCSASFCSGHIGLDKHGCTASEPTEPLEIPASSWKKRAQCQAEGCSKPALASAFGGSPSSQEILNDGLCPLCQGEFCVTHRHGNAHDCKHSIVGRVEDKTVKARALLAQNFPSTVQKVPIAINSPSRAPTDPKKLEKYRALELMKLRHKAIPGDSRNVSVPIEQRLHVSVSGGDGPKHNLWFKKDVVSGKALDLIAARMKMSFPLKLVKPGIDDESVQLDLSRPLSSQVDDGGELLILKP
ncbi:uncharacterized protein EI90DRAFT_3051430 [Cantharellus anzutake]|uniref:uncharacterized protein n=1 Tax=Cantharellus anzutake TaxID=1750568 RepID=UPI0019035963|nr:uncharacterized protein EI90DRAFT_3051430 [Cantharellus anzutake]KAF8334193.1 hypothetical protein EI90DRAFT_3051430 [Cantharellus anzutake]